MEIEARNLLDPRLRGGQPDREEAAVLRLALDHHAALLRLERQPDTKIANHAYYTFWYVLPTMPMFLLMPWMMHRGVNFWLSLAAGCALTIGCVAVAAVVLKRFGIGLLP